MGLLYLYSIFTVTFCAKVSPVTRFVTTVNSVGTKSRCFQTTWLFVKISSFIKFDLISLLLLIASLPFHGQVLYSKFHFPHFLTFY